MLNLSYHIENGMYTHKNSVQYNIDMIYYEYFDKWRNI